MADQGTEGLLSPFLRTRRLAVVRKYLTGAILDFGCGSGALAEFVQPGSYVGVDRDEVSLQLAGELHPEHTFYPELPDEAFKFDTIVALAVIEHLKDPIAFLQSLALRLHTAESRIIVTTPHPKIDFIHTIGARAGLFSKHGNEEHEILFDKKSLGEIAQKAGLEVAVYRRFLFGANQLFILRVYP